MWNRPAGLFGAAVVATVAVLAFAPALSAAEDDQAAAVAQGGAEDRTVLESRNTVIEEHRRAGEVYMIEVQKRNAGSYVLMDRDGQGHRESRGTDVENDVDTAKWSLIRW
jgi:hypothetical protein